MADFMEEALSEARLALLGGEVPVGCVMVSADGAVVARGRNATHRSGDATAHAEIVALRAMQKSFTSDKQHDSSRALTLYVTCEPCVMCAAAIVQSGLFTAVVFGCENFRFGGCGSVRSLELHSPRTGSALPDVKSGVRADEALELLVRFYQSQNPYAPKPNPRRKRMRENDASLPRV